MKKFSWETYYSKGGKGVGKWKTPEESIVKYTPFFKRKGIHLILDLGCGLGRNSIFLAKNGFLIVAADLSPMALNQTKKGLEKEKLKNFVLTKFDMYKKFPFPDNGFDAVISIFTIHHNRLNKIRKTVEEIRRIVRKKGLVLITTKSVKDWSFGKGKKLEKNTFIRPKGVHQAGAIHHFFDEKGIKNCFQNLK